MPKYVGKSRRYDAQPCTCTEALAANPVQLDCPWCGCGWLFVCLECRKPFLFGEVVHVLDVDLLTRKDNAANGLRLSDEDVRQTADWWRHWLADIEVGTTVVYFDGAVFDIKEAPLRYDGWYAAHDLPRLPHFEGAHSFANLKHALDRDYWVQRRRAAPVDVDPLPRAE